MVGGPQRGQRGPSGRGPGRSRATHAPTAICRKAADRNRTGNLQITNQVLCQLSYGGGGRSESTGCLRDDA